jgi:hypothetical protein
VDGKYLPIIRIWWPGRDLDPRRQPFQGLRSGGEIGGSIHAAFELLPQQSNNLAGLPQDLSRVPAVPEHNGLNPRNETLAMGTLCRRKETASGKETNNRSIS